MTLDAILQPHARDAFLATYVGKAPCLLPGATGRFAELVTMTEINEVLSRLPVSPGMMRILNADGPVPPGAYLKAPLSSAEPSAPKRRVQVYAVEHLMASGATLIMDNCEGLFPRIAEVCVSLAHGLMANLTATLFVVLKSESPIAFHWDSHDVLVAQVAGRKRWPVYKPLVEHPLENGFKGNGPPVLFSEQVLEPGDALYLPRGWPHQPSAVETPCVHVTFDVVRPNGADLVRLLLPQILEDPLVRADLPLTESPEARKHYAEHVRRVLAAVASDEALGRLYMAYELMESRPLRLPT